MIMKAGFSCSIALFILLEFIRITSDHFEIIKMYGNFVKGYYQENSHKTRFIDERDNDRLISTHIFLLLGCAYPFLISWESYKDEVNIIKAFAGITIIGIGDSFVIIEKQ